MLDAMLSAIVLQAQEDLFQCSFGLIDMDISIQILAHCVNGHAGLGARVGING